MSLLMVDLGYLGIKSFLKISRFLGIASYNIIALIGGYETILFFPKSHEQQLLEEIKDLKKEIVRIKYLMVNKHPETDFISIEEVKEPVLIEYHDN